MNTMEELKIKGIVREAILKLAGNRLEYIEKYKHQIKKAGMRFDEETRISALIYFLSDCGFSRNDIDKILLIE